MNGRAGQGRRGEERIVENRGGEERRGEERRKGIISLRNSRRECRRGQENKV